MSPFYTAFEMFRNIISFQISFKKEGFGVGCCKLCKLMRRVYCKTHLPFQFYEDALYLLRN